LGILSSGLLARFAAGPLFTPFLVNAVMLVIAGAALLLVRDRTRGPARRNRGALRLQLAGIPASAKRMFLAASPGAITVCAACGLCSAGASRGVGPAPHVTASAVTGTVVFLPFGAWASAPPIFRALSGRRVIIGGTVTMIVSMGAVVAALLAGSLPVLI